MSPHLATLWDAEEARDAALARVESHSPVWRTFADQALRTVAHRERFVTSETVWTELARMAIPKPPEPRAMGVVMRAGVRAGLIAFDGYERSTDPKSHADPQARYRSLVAR